jgi:hypothetical protein
MKEGAMSAALVGALALISVCFAAACSRRLDTNRVTSIKGVPVVPNISGVQYRNQFTTDLRLLRCSSRRAGTVFKISIRIANPTTSDYAVSVHFILHKDSGDQAWNSPTFTAPAKRQQDKRFSVTAASDIINVRCGAFEATPFAY